MRLACSILVLSLTATSLVGQTRLESLYTDLRASRCRTLEVDEESGSSVQQCPGIAGYKLQVLDDDARQSITIVLPDGTKHPLDFWQVVTGAFSSVGDKAEWRIARKKKLLMPVALIVRVNANEDPEHPHRINSYLAVTKIEATRSCVVAKIRAGRTANTEARRMADNARRAPCLKTP